MPILADFTVSMAPPVPDVLAPDTSSVIVDNSTGPRTSETPCTHFPLTVLAPYEGDVQLANAGSSGAKRKFSCRTNAAQRCATHNAVDHECHDYPDAHSHDLAGLLANLPGIQRQVKPPSHILIAHILASHRHRADVARKLYLLKPETNVLPREVNQWRECLGLSCVMVDELARSDSFKLILAGEMELSPSTSTTLEAVWTRTASTRRRSTCPLQ
jgi:hypothetical protein